MSEIAPVPLVAQSEAADEEPLSVYVLFLDMVDSSREATDRQLAISARLTTLVAGTREFQTARANGDLISLPTGDGMALVFLKRIQAPLRCAIEIAEALRADPFCTLRMGIHAGLVFASEDINGKRNVSGAGINIAERVMSCGKGGHILVSATAAESLRHLTRWRDKLTDLGEFRAKKDTVHIWNFVDGEIGSTERLRVPQSRFLAIRNRVLVVMLFLIPWLALMTWRLGSDFGLGGVVGFVLAPPIILFVYWWRRHPKRIRPAPR